MTYDGSRSHERRRRVRGVALARASRVSTQVLRWASAAQLFGLLATPALAWDDAPLCMARPPDREEAPQLGLDFGRGAELSCLPGDMPANTGPLWTAPIEAAEARQALLDADLLAKDGRLADALLKLRVVEHAMPRIGDRIALRRAQLLLRLGLPDDAYAAYRVAEASPERNIAAQARLGAVRCMLDAGKRQGESELDKASKRYPLLSGRGSLQLSLARAKETWGNPSAAAAIYRAIDLHEPQSPAAEAARLALSRLRSEGVALKPYSAAERIERAERIVKGGTFEAGREVVAELCADKTLPAAIRGRAHSLGARIARIEGDWERAREEVRVAMTLGAPEAQRYLPRAMPPVSDEAEQVRLVEQGEAKVRKLVGPRPCRRGRSMQLKAALDVAVQYELADTASDLLGAIEINKQAPPALRFQSAIIATGLASDESVLELLDTIKNNRPFALQARYHRARALERLGRNTEASAEYRNVVQLDNTATPYYGMWAGLRLNAISEPAERGNNCSGIQADGRYCPTDPRQLRAPGEGLMPPRTDAELTLAAMDSPDLELQESQRVAILARLAPLVAAHGAAYPWLARAADLVKLDLFEDAADEIGETYLAYRDARGTPRFRSGVDAVLTGAVPARHLALGTLRRDRLALGPIARGELASISDLLGDPGVSLRLRDEHREVRPRAYAGAVEAAAAKYGVDPNLLFAVMRVESIYHRQIVSYAGAVGLMQIMPRTGMLISRELGVEDFDVLDLLDPRTNLEFAAWYLGSLIKRFDGRLPLAIASYNGGPHNVRLWMSGYPKQMPLDAFLERIPFDQTHRYVRRVRTHYAEGCV
jgi:hypothetical protein